MSSDPDKMQPDVANKPLGSSGMLGDLADSEVNSVVNEYMDIYDSVEEDRKSSYKNFVNNYYDLATEFYEFGWGSSFHFANRRKGESFKNSLCRHQHFLADKMGLMSGMRILDAGCGIGGPMMELARYSGANFVGLNNNQYQIKRANQRVQDQGVSSLCNFVHGDFMHIPEDDNSFDGAYAIESMPHAPNKILAFQEILRILRPGGYFAGYDWCLTELFDPENPTHERVARDIAVGNALPQISTTTEVYEALGQAGFEVVEVSDLALHSDDEYPWYAPLDSGEFSFRALPRTPVGRAITNMTLGIGEKIRLVPKGARAVSAFLNKGADARVEGGKSGTFTVMYFFLARKPAR